MSGLAAAQPDRVNLTEASKRTNIPEITLRRWVAKGWIEGAIKVGSEWELSLRAVEATAAKRPRRPASKVTTLPTHNRWIGVVDTGLVQQLEECREELRRLRRENERLVGALIDQLGKRPDISS